MEAYNLKKVNELAAGDESFIKALIEAFLEEIPSDLEKMEKAVQEKKSKIVYQYAHKMKPNFQLFGIDVIAEIRLIESWSEKSINYEEVKQALSIVSIKAKKAIEALEQN